ncbi:MAG: sulfatase [Candidatus Omnitrophica bacterium]|nr:sulfatase [Candidatus Omnitrophota bacterium]
MRSKVWLAVRIGAVVGALVGAAECLALLLRIPSWPLDTPTIPVAMMIYGFIAAVMAGVWGLAAWRRLDHQTFQVRTVMCTLLAMTYLLGGYWIHRWWSPQLLALPSLLVTGLWTLAWLIGSWILLRPPGRPSASFETSWVRPLRGLMLGLLVVAGASLMLPSLWIRTHQVLGARDVPGGTQRPNILLIVMDTARADRFSSYGYHRKTTPNLDRLAQDGVLFERASSAAPWTLPSHATLFTGLYPAQHQAERPHPRLDSRFATLAELLYDHGYQTAGFSNNHWVSREMNFHQGFEHFDDMLDGGRLINRLAVVRVMKKVTGLVTRRLDDGAEATNQSVRRWLKTVFDPGRPFFVFINYREPHFPYKPPEAFRSRFLRHPREPVEKVLEVAASLHRFAPAAHQAARVDRPMRQLLNDLYDGEIAYLDAKIGELLGELETRRLLDDTVVIVTSDHGENIGDHGLFGHQFSVYETLLHVPLVLRYPAGLPAGRRVAERVSLVDLLPTLIELLSLAAPSLQAALPGHSWVGSSLVVAPDLPIRSEYAAPVPMLARSRTRGQAIDERSFMRSLKSLSRGGVKFIWASDGHHELYDLRHDPGESQNVIQQFPDTARALKAELDQWLTAMQSAGTPEDVEPMREWTRKELRALGYLQ